jgi:hypothetical protein
VAGAGKDHHRKVAPGLGPPAGAFKRCISNVSVRFHVVAYQPASRYWPFQWYESGIFVALAFLHAGFSFWWLRHRAA